MFSNVPVPRAVCVKLPRHESNCTKEDTKDIPSTHFQLLLSLPLFGPNKLHPRDIAESQWCPRHPRPTKQKAPVKQYTHRKKRQCIQLTKRAGKQHLSMLCYKWRRSYLRLDGCLNKMFAFSFICYTINKKSTCQKSCHWIFHQIIPYPVHNLEELSYRCRDG